jgi:tartrate-resistant acid phosphatase type 5
MRLLVILALSLIVLADNNATLTFIVIGDWGRNGLKNQSEVATSMGKWCQQYGPCDFVISTGDNMYQDGVKDEHAEQFATSFENVYIQPGLEGLRWYVVLGNHDYQYVLGVK